MYSFKLKNSISIKLLKVVFVIYFSLTATITLIHMYYEYQHTKNAIKTEIVDLESIFSKPLAQSLWNFDVDQTETILNSIQSLHFVTGVRLISKDGVVTKNTGITTREDELVYKFELIQSVKNQDEHLGFVELYSKSDVVIERVKVGFYLIIVNAIIKSIILWILLLWAFNKFLTKPIVSFATKVQNINLDNIEESEFLKNQAVSNLENSDEIEVFKNRFSIMLQKIYSSKIELINAENAKREQEKIILLQYKKAALGDLISIIAHQLKQPLSSISLCMGGIEDIFEQNELTQEAFDTYSKTITNQIDFMSSSIDDLKNFRYYVANEPTLYPINTHF